MIEHAYRISQSRSALKRSFVGYGDQIHAAVLDKLAEHMEFCRVVVANADCDELAAIDDQQLSRWPESLKHVENDFNDINNMFRKLTADIRWAADKMRERAKND